MSIIEINPNFNPGINSLHIFILMVSIVWLMLLIYSLKTYGIKKTIRYFVPIMIAGIIGELCAMANSGYYYNVNPGYLINVTALGGSVPIIIGLGWSVNLFICLHLAKDIVPRLFKEQNFRQLFFISIFAGFFALCLDLLEDPLAHHNGWWIWPQTAQKIYLFDVPLTNYAGWFGIVGGMTLLTLLIDRSHFSENRKLLINLTTPFIFFIFLVVYFTLM